MSSRRARTDRRAAERAAERLAEDCERLWRLERGGSPEQPLAVDSASVIEVRAAATPCPVCQGALLVVQHRAVVHQGLPLRAVELQCRACGRARTQWFRVGSAMAN